MPHLHLSLQSGDDMVLKRMKRRHSRADAVRFCAEARRLRPDIVFGADLIAGFPTETDAMFDGSLRLIDDCGLTFLHVFPFSPRPGTPAARMPQVARSAIKEQGGAAPGERRRRTRRPPRRPDRQRRRAADGAGASGTHAGVRRDGAGGSGHAGTAAAGPRHRVRRQAVARRAVCAQVGAVNDTPAKTRGLMGLFRRSEAPLSLRRPSLPRRLRLQCHSLATRRATGRAAEKTGLVPTAQGRA